MSYIGNPIVSTDFPVDYASGNGSTTAFTLSVAPASVNSIDVQISGVSQSPQTYSVSGTTLTFSAAPPSGTNNIVVRHKGVAGIPNTPSAGSVVTASIADANVTQAKLASGVAGTGPAFSAYRNAIQSVANNTQTKLQFNTELFDTNLNYDTTNYRFTPTVAGYYQVSGGFTWQNQINGYGSLSLYKNGSQYTTLAFGSANGATNQYLGHFGGCLIYLNGSSDYIELYAYQVTGSSQNTGGTTQTDSYFTACLVRNA